MMNVDIKGVHMDVSQRVRDYLDKKMKRLSYAEDLIVDMLFTLTQDTKAYKTEVNINFRWGTSSHIGVESYNIIKGIDQLFDKMDVKINKEKEKIQEHG
ncbi:MAG: ribosomal subunit interface protein [Spirochaetales bacterium]|nr:ribosomal subunit interface protein [Spirochaetales bacterium]